MILNQIMIWICPSLLVLIKCMTMMMILQLTDSGSYMSTDFDCSAEQRALRLYA